MIATDVTVLITVLVLISLVVGINIYGLVKFGQRSHRSRSWFSRFGKWSADVCGRSIAFVGACVVLLVWVATGPIFKFSDTWQLVINTGTTIVTFLMVFLIQNTQNREDEMTQIKLDEIIRALNGAHNQVIDTDDESDDELAGLLQSYRALGKKARDASQMGVLDTDSPDIDCTLQPLPHGRKRSSSN